MSDQIITPDLFVELSKEEQQLLSGGMRGFYRSHFPRRHFRRHRFPRHSWSWW
ncbi:MAG: hypothetical protein HWQ35_13925 [Nostoc sp. NMS1]|uniref:hypothetical protein n=1 Tax=unclassified Nostoc TaxID=2593658 RepID=UPI0025D8244C|nr:MULTISPECIES: hypothetical protein [unclassified Nostoc]MBN3907608.1 hypothetical protein [Nostoc sp. NMS1]MBN3995011.1 hypothetical protein [Nostoc sp. NMS2]